MLQAGKAYRDKSVLQARPSYIMSNFLLPKSLFDDITSIIPQLWWSNHDKQWGICLLKWEDLCTRKDNDGLGFRDNVEIFNTS